jgi:oligopeptide transport system ATP-binding protein
LKPPLLEIRGLRVDFRTLRGVVRAVDRVSLRVDEGETLGIVGESGSGKSVTSLAVMGLVPSPPGIVEADAISFDGRDLRRLSPREWRAIRGREIAMVFQDPGTSLNPLMTIGRQLGEVLETHERCPRRAARRRTAAALAEVGIANPEERLDAHPHELSGGMRQRVMIAMALLCKPKLLLADEPTTALDATVQAQILDLLEDLQREHGTAIALVTHSLGVVVGAADRVVVMYAGRIVESASARELLARPLHPYTLGLLRSVPRIDGAISARLPSIAGQPPNPSRDARRDSECAFRPRCPFEFARCGAQVPELEPALGARDRESDPALAIQADDSELRERADGVIAPSIRRSACFVREDLARIDRGIGSDRGTRGNR